MIGITWTLLGAWLLGIYNALLIKDDKLPESDPKNKQLESDWHAIGACIFVYLTITAWIFFGAKYILFSLSCFWTLFAGTVHTMGLDKPFFFVGTTAKTDQLLRKLSPNKPELVSAILKLVTLGASLFLIFL